MTQPKPTCQRCRHFQFGFGNDGFCSHPKLSANGHQPTDADGYCPRWRPKAVKDRPLSKAKLIRALQRDNARLLRQVAELKAHSQCAAMPSETMTTRQTFTPDVATAKPATARGGNGGPPVSKESFFNPPPCLELYCHGDVHS